jgi:hypothetical protein
MGERGYSCIILDLGIRRRRVVGFKAQPLYTQGKSPRYSTDRMSGGRQSRSGDCGTEKKSLCPWRDSKPAGRPARRPWPVAISTELSRLGWTENVIRKGEERWTILGQNYMSSWSLIICGVFLFILARLLVTPFCSEAFCFLGGCVCRKPCKECVLLLSNPRDVEIEEIQWFSISNLTL